MSGLFDPGVRYSVVGAARSGVAAANFLARLGRDVLLSDQKPAEKLGAEVQGLDPRVRTRFGQNEVRSGDVVVISPGVSPLSPTFAACVEAGRAVISEVELFAAWHRGPIAAITGTDGKSTTTKLVGDLLAAGGLDPFVGGNIGNALTEALPDLAPDRWVVAEVSNAQLITTDRFRPRVATVLNIAEDHTSYHGSFEAYQEAKRRVWQRMGDGDTLILNADDPYIAGWTLDARCPVQWFSPAGRPGHAARFADDAVCLGDARVIDWAEFPIPGRHNVENVLAATLMARAAGVDLDAIRGVLRSFKGLAHRMELVRELDGVRWYNDSKATNPHAAMAGLRGLDRPFVVLLGGYDKGMELGEMADLVAAKAHTAILMGAMRGRWEHALRGRLPVHVVETLPEAVSRARAVAPANGYVVLCPATSSFDQFRDFEHRGDTFRALVNALT
jgi:UDP-N-acetylmuramoylalanine--D-glutamate ligase